MRSPFSLKTWQKPSGKEVQVYIAAPHQFVIDHQQELLADWNLSPANLILFLQRSSISLKESSLEVAQEKDILRQDFIRFGCNLIFALQDRGYKSDLFDPRTGYPLLTRPGALRLDDNAVVKALLNYPVISYKSCSLIVHPLWGNYVYPSTIVSSAPHSLIESIIDV